MMTFKTCKWKWFDWITKKRSMTGIYACDHSCSTLRLLPLTLFGLKDKTLNEMPEDKKIKGQ